MDSTIESRKEPIGVILLDTFRKLLTREGILLWSALLLFIVWGPKGVPLFTPWFQPWIDAEPLNAGFRLQLLSFVSGIFLLFVVPIAIVKFIFKEQLSGFGLGWGDKSLGLRLILVTTVIGIPLFYLGSLQPAMWAEYPMIYRGLTTAEILGRFSWHQFIVYETLYVLFFVVIEFSFRGYMLFGLATRFALYAVLIQMMAHTLWHLPKPLPEFVPAPLWGFTMGALGLRARSIWYTVLIHWALNVFFDVLVLMHRGVIHLHPLA